MKEDHDSVSNCFIVGEGVIIDVGSSVKMALTNLLFCYYVWDLSYPKQYQLIGFLQHYRDNKFDMSSNYLKFTKKFDDVKLNVSEVEDEYELDNCTKDFILFCMGILYFIMKSLQN